MSKLPIDMIPGPVPQFEWSQLVTSPGDGTSMIVRMTGGLGQGAADAVAALVGYARRLEKENAELSGKIMTNAAQEWGAVTYVPLEKVRK